MRVHFPVVLTHVSGVTATGIRWRGEGSGGGRESVPTEGRPSKIRLRATKTTKLIDLVSAVVLANCLYDRSFHSLFSTAVHVSA